MSPHELVNVLLQHVCLFIFFRGGICWLFLFELTARSVRVLKVGVVGGLILGFIEKIAISFLGDVY